MPFHAQNDEKNHKTLHVIEMKITMQLSNHLHTLLKAYKKDIRGEGDYKYKEGLKVMTVWSRFLLVKRLTQV